MAAIADPTVQVVVELIGGTTTAKKIVLDALAAGKHVVTANKALLAEAGHEIFEAARKAGMALPTCLALAAPERLSMILSGPCSCVMVNASPRSRVCRNHQVQNSRRLS